MIYGKYLQCILLCTLELLDPLQSVYEIDILFWLCWSKFVHLLSILQKPLPHDHQEGRFSVQSFLLVAWQQTFSQLPRLLNSCLLHQPWNLNMKVSYWNIYRIWLTTNIINIYLQQLILFWQLLEHIRLEKDDRLVKIL